MLTIKQKTLVVSVLEKECFRYENGLFYSEIHLNKQRLDKESILDICSSESPREKLKEYIADTYVNTYFEEEIREKERLVEKVFCLDSFKKYKKSKEEVLEFIRDIHSIKLSNCETFEDQEVLINIIVNTGDLNSDFSINQPFASWEGRNATSIDEDSAILWLARQQGYKKTDLTKALRDREYGNSKFLKSMLKEVENTTSSMNSLTFLTRITLCEFIRLQEAIAREANINNKYLPRRSKGRGYIVLAVNTTCGLFSSWNGAGGPLEVKLEKDVRLYFHNIASALPDGAKGYSVGEVYCACESLWTPNAIKKIHEMKRTLKPLKMKLNILTKNHLTLHEGKPDGNEG